MKAKTFSYGGSAFSSKTHPSQSMFADGGEINDGLLNDFNSGGTHEENPNGGISQGVDQEGLLLLFRLFLLLKKAKLEWEITSFQTD